MGMIWLQLKYNISPADLTESVWKRLMIESNLTPDLSASILRETVHGIEDRDIHLLAHILCRRESRNNIFQFGRAFEDIYNLPSDVRRPR